MVIDIEDIVPAFVRAEPIFCNRPAFFLKSWNTCSTRYTEVICGLVCKELCGDVACWRWTTPKHVSGGWISQQFAYGCSTIRQVAVRRQITPNATETFCPHSAASQPVRNEFLFLFRIYWCQCLSRCSRRVGLFCSGLDVYRLLDVMWPTVHANTASYKNQSRLMERSLLTSF
jgi:hypothetical protein